MLIVERQLKAIEILQQRKTVQLEELSRELGVSVSTIRRDVEQFEQQGMVERTHGGVIYRGPEPQESARIGHSGSHGERMSEFVDQKKAIGKQAATLVKPQMTVLMDGGSTVVYAAMQITARPIQVVTNSLVIANLFADDEQIELLMIGGNLYPRTGVTIGPIANGCLADLHADLLLFSVAGFLDGAAYNVNMTMAEVEQSMMRQASTCALLMDSNKFGRKSLVRVCGAEELDHIITDSDIDQSWRDQLGDRLTVAPIESAPQQ